MSASACVIFQNRWMKRLAGLLAVTTVLGGASCAGKRGTDRLHPTFRLGSDCTKFAEITTVDGDHVQQDVVSYKGSHLGTTLLQYYHIENQQVTQYREIAKDGGWQMDESDEIEPYWDRIDNLVDDLVDEKRNGPQTCRDVPLIISALGSTYRRIFWSYPRELPLAPNGESGVLAALPDAMRTNLLAAVMEKLPPQYERHHASYLRATPVYDLDRTNIFRTVSFDLARTGVKDWVRIAIICPYVLVPVPKGIDVFAEFDWDCRTGQHVLDSKYGRLYFIETFQGNFGKRRSLASHSRRVAAAMGC